MLCGIWADIKDTVPNGGYVALYILSAGTGSYGVLIWMNLEVKTDA